MIYKATKAIEAKLKEKDMKCTIKETDETSAVRAGVGADNFSYELLFISSDDDSDVAVRAFDLLRIPENKRESILPAINQLNRRFRFYKFSMDDDGDIRAEYDFPLRTPMDQVGEFAYELLVRSMDIFDKAYSDLMKAIWA